MVERILIFFIILFSTVLSSNLGPYQSVLSSNRLPVSLVEKLSSDEANTIHILTFLGSQSTPIIRQTRNLIANTISTTNENYYFVDCEGTEASQDIFSVSDTVVLFVSHQQLQWGQDEIIAQVEDILEASLHSQKPQSLVFVLEKHDKKSALVRDLQTSIENLVSLKKLHSPNSLLLLPKIRYFDLNTVNVNANVHDEVTINRIVHELRTTNTVSKRVAVMPSFSSVSVSPSTSTQSHRHKHNKAMKTTTTADLEGVQTGPILVEDFLSLITEKLEVLDVENWLQSAGPNKGNNNPLLVVEEIVQNIAQAVADTHEEHTVEHEFDLLDMTETVVLPWSAQLLRSKLYHVLVPYYERLVRQILSLLTQLVTKQLQQQPLPSAVFNQLIGQVMEEGTMRIRSLQQEFEQMVNQDYSNGLLAHQKKEKKYHFVWPTQQLQQLQHTLLTIHEHTLGAAVLSGKHNPYTRTAPFPPCHLNFNYQLDPSSFRMFANPEDLALRQSYDEQKPGFAPGKADPLQFKGVAPVPFDPTVQPVSRDELAQEAIWEKKWIWRLARKLRLLEHN